MINEKYALKNFYHSVREGHFNLADTSQVSTSIHIHWAPDKYINITLPEGWWLDDDEYPAEQLREGCKEYLSAWISTRSGEVKEFLAWLDEGGDEDRPTNSELFDHVWALRRIEQQGKKLAALQDDLRRLRVSTVINISYFKENQS